MNGFQYIVLVLIASLMALTLRGVLRGQMRKRVAALWLTVWVAGATVLVWPQATFLLARRLGIGRGADLVLYTSVLFTFVGFFYVYTRFRRVDRQVTLLVRKLAIENARPPVDR